MKIKNPECAIARAEEEYGDLPPSFDEPDLDLLRSPFAADELGEAACWREDPKPIALAEGIVCLAAIMGVNPVALIEALGSDSEAFGWIEAEILQPVH